MYKRGTDKLRRRWNKRNKRSRLHKANIDFNRGMATKGGSLGDRSDYFSIDRQRKERLFGRQPVKKLFGRK